MLKYKSIIKVFTDGSFSKSVSGIKCGYGIHFPNNEMEDIAKPLSLKPYTNQRAELYAIYKAIKVIKKTYKFDTIELYTDSEYSIKSLTIWSKQWILNGWKTSNNKEVLNQDIIKKILKYLNKYKVNFHHVKAHTNKNDDSSKFNDVADKLAKKGGSLSQ